MAVAASCARQANVLDHESEQNLHGAIRGTCVGFWSIRQ